MLSRVRSHALDGASLLIPALLGIQFSLVGRLTLAEAVLLAASPLIVRRAREAGARPIVAWPLVLCGVWFVAQVETDLYRDTAQADVLRGWSRILVFAANAYVLSYLVGGNRRRMVLFATGLPLGALTGVVLHINEAVVTDPWKFALGTPVITMVALCVSGLPDRAPAFTGPLLMGGAAVFNLLMGFRSLAGVCFITAAYLLAHRYGPAGQSGRALSPFAVVALFGVALGASAGFIEFYAHEARSGALGVNAERRFLEQDSSSQSILFEGRPELIGSIRAIRDSPLLGHGSYAKDAYYLRYIEHVQHHPYFAATASDPTTIPTHSHIGSAWVDAGIGGALLWLAFTGLAILTLVRLFSVSDRLLPFVAFLAVLVLWDIQFSPFGLERRLTMPYYLVVFLTFRPVPRSVTER